VGTPSPCRKPWLGLISAQLRNPSAVSYATCGLKPAHNIVSDSIAAGWIVTASMSYLDKVELDPYTIGTS
jgi:hypothetical protein